MVMTRKKVYLIIQTVLCVVLVLLLSAAAIRLYREGEALKKAGDLFAEIYSPDKIAAAFAGIAPLFFGAIGFMAAGLLLGTKDEKADLPVKDAGCIRDLTVSRVAVPSAEMNRERGLQKKYRVSGWAAFAACMIPVFLYMINPAHFNVETTEPDFVHLLTGTGPWIILGFVCMLVMARLSEKSILRETEAAKVRIAEEKEKSSENVGSAPAAAGTRGVTVVRVLVLAAAVVFIVLGIQNGSMGDVLNKARVICSECIGLG